METVVVLVVAVGGLVAVAKWRASAAAAAAVARQRGWLQHERSGEYPSSCSWCKNTALARKLMMFERRDGSWRAFDAMALLQQCRDSDVGNLVARLVSDQPQSRRFCTEKCAREFFAAEHFQAVEAFSSCDYCSSRSPVALARCPNCGAARR